MATKGREGAVSSLNAAVGALNLAKDASTITPAKAAFDSAGVLLTTIRVSSLPLYVAVDRWLMYTGHNDQQNELRRTRASLCRCL